MAQSRMAVLELELVIPSIDLSLEKRAYQTFFHLNVRDLSKTGHLFFE